ncbi:MAG: GxxExxY protein [Phycisphaeraceae bacterium]
MMHTDQDKELVALSERVIGAAFEVSNVLGIGFLEKVYERAMCRELQLCGLHVACQERIKVFYKDECVGDYLAGLVVERRLIVEIKCVEGFADEHLAQYLNYLRATSIRVGLLLNFQHPKLQIKRVSL